MHPFAGQGSVVRLGTDAAPGPVPRTLCPTCAGESGPGPHRGRATGSPGWQPGASTPVPDRTRRPTGRERGVHSRPLPLHRRPVCALEPDADPGLCSRPQGWVGPGGTPTPDRPTEALGKHGAQPCRRALGSWKAPGSPRSLQPCTRSGPGRALREQSARRRRKRAGCQGQPSPLELEAPRRGLGGREVGVDGAARDGPPDAGCQREALSELLCRCGRREACRPPTPSTPARGDPHTPSTLARGDPQHRPLRPGEIPQHRPLRPGATPSTICSGQGRPPHTVRSGQGRPPAPSALAGGAHSVVCAPGTSVCTGPSSRVTCAAGIIEPGHKTSVQVAGHSLLSLGCPIKNTGVNDGDGHRPPADAAHHTGVSVCSGLSGVR